MNNFSYPLVENPFSDDDIKKGISVLNSKQLTLSTNTFNFEKKFKNKIKSNFSLMVNSGSSANLLAFQCLINPYRKKRLEKNSEIIIPSLCWSTSLWPIIQSNLKPIFVDINKDTLNIDIDDLEKKITKKTKAIMLIHVLGNCCDMDRLMQIKKKHNLILIEDTCESLGTKFNNKYLGTFGEFSSFSFYTSHQISAGEGGMICCKDKNDYEIIKSLRSHGWSRGTSFEKKYKNDKYLNKKFIFFNSGFNLRPTEISAAIGYNQFKRLEKMKNSRNSNRKKIINAFKDNKVLRDTISFFQPSKKVKPSWFGLPLRFYTKHNLNKILIKLEKMGVETRPIISGNFTRQPAAKVYKLFKKNNFRNTDEIYNSSFFIGLPTPKLKKKKIKKLVKIFEKIFKN